MGIEKRGFASMESTRLKELSGQGGRKAHVKNILAKLKVQDRTAAVSVAVRRGIIQLD